MRRIVTALVLALALCGPASASQDCDSDGGIPSVHCGRTPTAVFDDGGRLWIAFEFGGRIYVTAGDDDLESLSTPVAVNEDAEAIDVNGENRPKIAIGPGGEVYVSWTRKLPGGFNGEIRFSRSLDGGASFEPVRTINDDGLVTGHRFETLVVDSGGDVYLAWIDKRDRLAATEAGESYAGAAVYYAVSTDRGKTFAENRRAAAHSCECCRIAATEAASGDIALFYRGIFGDNIRDHAFVTVDAEGVTTPMQRATDDEWHIDACPHHGPSLVSAGAGAFDLAWFTNGERRKGVFYARLDADDGELTRLSPVSTDPSAGHPALLRVPGRLLIAWKEFTGEQTVVRLIESGDDGRTWSEPATLASTQRDSDHPFLVARGDAVFLSWHTADEGLRVLAVGGRAQRVDLQVFGPGSMRDIERAHAGSPFVVAVWATDCPPCRRELELLGTFAKRHPDVPVVLIATDPPGNAGAVEEVLASFELPGAEALQFGDAGAERLRHAIDPTWRGEMPRTYLYGHDGTRAGVSGPISDALLERWLEGSGN